MNIKHFPSNAILAVDTETRDDGLARDSAPGWVAREGYIVGFSVAWNDEAFYVPVRHPNSPNIDTETAFGWLQDAMNRAKKVVFHNRPYDEGWLGTENVVVPENADDTHAMAVMLDENRYSYSLDAIAKIYGVQGKDEQLLQEAAARFGVDPKGELWKLSSEWVAPYATQDARATLGLYRVLETLINEEELVDAYTLERDLIPLTIAMRRRGIRIDEDRAVAVQKDLRRQRDELLETIRQKTGINRRLTMSDLMSPISLATMFDAENLEYPLTPKTKKGSFKREWLEAHTHWLPNAVVAARKLENMAEKFIGTYVLENTHLGRIHAEIHQLRDDNGGTRSYRFSYANPPLQQIPARDKLAPLIRGIFLPEEGELWCAADFSSQEPRLTVHFASLCSMAGSDAAVDQYNTDPRTDYHQMVADMTGLPRKSAKIINLGLAYGLGVKKLGAALGVDPDEAKSIIEQYNQKMPFIKELSQYCERLAATRGYIRLIDGARCRFNSWEPADRGWNGDALTPAPTREIAAERWPNKRLKRAGTRKAFNRLIQGSAARQTKIAMRLCWREGIIPLLSLHDELDTSVSDKRTGDTVDEIMRSAVNLKIPVVVDSDYGLNWGDATIGGTYDDAYAKLRG